MLHASVLHVQREGNSNEDWLENHAKTAEQIFEWDLSGYTL